ncbi:papain-like cysteine protease family protein [Falsiroseomonas ponticola]|uniref:papain-like cysteine protease family protein n=1 Tax=Falsiroseomonas ponticola TaxID=2786951 RepID=UPI0019329987|nr:papain-like cysteine protease family protein [Roseomonas ponticola]
MKTVKGQAGRRHCLALAAASWLAARRADAQWPPIDLGIPNIPQQTPVWCWVAVAEQIIRWRNGGAGPSQAELVAIANGFPPFACLQPPNPMVMQACLRTGHLVEIQRLISAFGGGFSQLAPPAHPGILYDTLRRGAPIILAVRSTPFSGHVVVLRGLVPAPDPLLIINDPMGWPGFGQPVPFSRIAGFWQAAIVVG